jgi:hypothetical protein
MKVRHQRVQLRPVARRETVVTKAAQRAAESLGLNQRELGEVIGVSEAKVSRLGRMSALAENKKEFELALLFLRLFRSLDALVGGDEDKARLWLHAENRYFGDVPANLIRSVEGLTRVVQYLDAMRGPL